MQSKEDWVEIYTDGSCMGNPGRGGWAALLRWKGNERLIYGIEENVTNNQMELQAACEGLLVLKGLCNVTIHTDSQYVVKGMTEWKDRWIDNGFLTAAGNPVKNQDRWLLLISIASQHNVVWNWVKGHSGNPYHDRADEAAHFAAKFNGNIPPKFGE